MTGGDIRRKSFRDKAPAEWIPLRKPARRTSRAQLVGISV